MIIQTTRFGGLEVEDDKVLTFPQGLLGLPGSHRYVLLHDQSKSVFRWLQSCDEPDVALVVVEPRLFFPDYQVQLSVEELEEIGVKADEGDELEVLAVLVVPSDPRLITANLMAPLVINVTRRQGGQAVLHDSTYGIRHYLFPVQDKGSPQPELARASGGQP